jgi:hypothetical protein
MRAGLVVVSMAAGVVLAGCGTQIDVNVTGAGLVAGTPNLYRFCDGPILIYFSQWDGANDNYEAFFNGGCVWANNQWLPGVAAPIPEGFTEPSAPPDPAPAAPPTVQDDTNQQDERDEGH